MHAIHLFGCWWFWDGTLLHAVCPRSFWTQFEAFHLKEKEQKKKILNVFLSCSEQNGLCCQDSQFQSGREGREKSCVKAHCTFFSLLWSVSVCSPFGGLTKRFDVWRHVFFMWESASAIFYPQLLFMGSKCQKNASVSKANLIKVAVWKVHALIYIFSITRHCVQEFRICLCDSGSQLFTLKCECAKCMQPKRKTDVFLSWIMLVVELYRGHGASRCTA